MTVLQSNISDAISPLERIRQLEEMVERLKKGRGNGRLTLKVSKAGALSVYGMGRWPVTLYRSQWERLLNASAEISAFIEANSDSLAVKE